MKIALGWRWTNLGALLAQPQKNTDVEGVYICRCLFWRAGFPRQTRNLNQSHLRRRKQGWGREKALNLSVSALLTNCNVATCWHVELSTLNLLLLWLNIYLSNSFNSSIHVFHSKIALGWPCTNLGALLAQPQKNTESRENTYACFGGQAFQGKPQSHLQRRKQGWGREKALNLSVSAPLTNCNVATCWHVELSTLNLLLLWLNIYLSNSFNSSIHVFQSKIALGWRCKSWGVACATTEKHWCLRSTLRVNVEV